MKLLEKEQESEVQVVKEDQDKINQFSILNINLSELEEEKKTLETEVEGIEEFLMEIELLDDDELVRYQLNDIFIELKVEAARERSEKQLETSKAKLDELSDKTDSIRSKMDALKKVLYGKFGQSINLEVD